MLTASCGGHKMRNDIFFITILCAVISIGALCLYFFRTDGNTVNIIVDGEIYGVYSLDENMIVEILTGESKTNKNIIVISDGKAYVSEADCPDGICSEHRPISHNGESIICLPHKVVIEVVTKEELKPDIIQ